MRKTGGTSDEALRSAAFAVYAVVTLLSLQIRINGKKAENEALAAQAERQTQINASLQESLASEVDDQYVAGLAREKFGLVVPGEKVFVDVSN
jgi:cell division protein FtsB